MKSLTVVDKPEIEAILAANFYLLKCRLENNCQKSSLARKLLTSLVKKALAQRVKKAAPGVVL